MRDPISRMSSDKVLILSDDKDAACVWSYALSQRGITPLAKQIDQTLQLPTDLNSYDLIIIDHYAATMEVFPLCQQIRKDFT